MNVAVVGCGYWGKKLVERFVKVLGPEHVYAADINSDTAIKVARDNKLAGGLLVPDKLSWREELRAWDFIDAYVLATPIDTHYQMTKDCLEVGKDVLVEKPIAKSYVKAKELADLASSKKLVLMTDLTFLFNDRFRELESRGIVSLDLTWLGPKRTNDRHDEDILWNWGPHPMSIILKLCGDYGHNLIKPTINKADEVRFEAVLSRDERGLNPFRCNVHMKYTLGEPVRRLGIESPGVGLSYSSADLLEYGLDAGDPLENVCKEFVYKVNARDTSQDVISLRTVEGLECIEKLRE